MIALLLTALLLLAGLFAFFLQQPQFGKKPTGDRLDRVRRSPNYRDGAFQNRSPTPTLPEGVTYWNMLGLLFRRTADAAPKTPLPSVRTTFEAPLGDKPSVTWFGHSSYLIQLDGKNILVDPVFSGHASPVFFFGGSFKGSDVYSAADMPTIDILLLTHDHYDHLDYPTIRQLRPKVRQVVASLGLGAHLEHWGYPAAMIHELDWHETAVIDAALTIHATPARHFSGRRFTRGQTLWSSFVLRGASAKIYAGGDSGYDTHFKEIGAQYGPFDFALLECGQYFHYWPLIHVLPEETAQAAADLAARAVMPVPWAKFNLAPHAWRDPIERVTRHARTLGLDIATPRIGERVMIGGPYPAEA